MDPTPDPAENTKRDFQRLRQEWTEGVAGLSSPRAIAGHPAYREIIAMGPVALPPPLQDRRDNRGFWHPVLREITGANPAPECHGDLRSHDDAWIRWAQSQGHGPPANPVN